IKRKGFLKRIKDKNITFSTETDIPFAYKSFSQDLSSQLLSILKDMVINIEEEQKLYLSKFATNVIYDKEILDSLNVKKILENIYLLISTEKLSELNLQYPVLQIKNFINSL
ncbi:hypothetical protein, partial [Psittacicella gerlachiana]